MGLSDMDHPLMWVASWPGGQEGFETESEAERFAARKLPELASMNRFCVVFEIEEKAS